MRTHFDLSDRKVLQLVKGCSLTIRKFPRLKSACDWKITQQQQMCSWNSKTSTWRLRWQREVTVRWSLPFTFHAHWNPSWTLVSTDPAGCSQQSIALTFTPFVYLFFFTTMFDRAFPGLRKPVQQMLLWKVPWIQRWGLLLQRWSRPKQSLHKARRLGPVGLKAPSSSSCIGHLQRMERGISWNYSWYRYASFGKRHAVSAR